jgi:spore coat polysaccharide biosynthesis protein SpsF
MILAIVQARSSSRRLPGKVLAPVEGAPMILRQLERLARSSMIDELVVATSVEESDDPLVEVLEAESVECRRGPLDDVASRFLQVADEFEPDSIVRLTADCPLADHRVIDRVISEHIQSGADYTSNTLERTYPQGLDVECMTSVAFSRLMRLPLSATEQEHVTLGMYSRTNEFELKSVTQSPDHSALRWTVDLPEDLAFVRTIYDALYAATPDFAQKDILDFLARNPELSRTN